MTDTTITQGFIEMVKAYEAKPELEAQIVKLTEDRDFFERHLTIANDLSSKLYADIDALNAKLLEVSRERDDAMFRNLELEELKDKIGSLAGQLLGSLKQSDPQSTQIVIQPEAAGPIMSQSVESSEPMTGYPGPIDPVVVEPQPKAPLPSLSPGEPDGWERGKPYSYKPWYMTDEEWVGRGGFGPPQDTVKLEDAWAF
jgi:hypothetical protein